MLKDRIAYLYKHPELNLVKVWNYDLKFKSNRIKSKYKKQMSDIFKIMLLGDVSTGKTSFMTQLIYQNA